MVHLPFKIANPIVADLKNGGRVLEDVHSTVEGHISQLPDEILECILNKLKLRDAVRASLVSSRWRHLVLSRAKLVFDLSNIFEMESCDLKGASEKKCVCSEYKVKFVQAVYQFIASYRGRCIRKFIVHFCLKRQSTSDVMDWIRFALDLGVKAIDLQFYCEHCSAKGALCGTQCEIPIKHLLSSNCDAGATFSLRPFSHVEALRFDHTRLRSQCIWSSLSTLVNLKQLKMEFCELPPDLSLNSLTSLERVSVLFCVGLKKIELASLKIKSLRFVCERTLSLELTGVPNLEILQYAMPENGLWYKFLKLPEFVPHLRALRLDCNSNWLEHMPESTITFSRLGILNMELDPRVGDIMFKVVQLLKLCPLLLHLYTSLCAREDKEPEKLESIDEYHHECLERITIREFVGTKYQIESCKYLLKLAPGVKKLELGRALPDTLSCLKEAGCRSHPMSEEECDSAVNALKLFSIDAKVFFI
ncbi:hypothetical protein DM860_016388 [Cuscuta australis]|uniref:F-box domain-containing protein n=1 Tax=Cuscuta australis TaxID=267555 RepID=A0A328DE21_9ASTE|nr:hypothetical protein DM860_016388 [Cuscuta australis]